jgi:hypothetical protein
VPVAYLAAARLAFIAMKLFRAGAHTLRDRRKHLICNTLKSAAHP